MAEEISDHIWAELFGDDEEVSLSAKHTIVIFYQGLVYGVARKLESRLPSWVADEDLLSAGQEGLLKAVDRYDPARGIPFRRFASGLIHGAIIDDLRRQDWAPRSLRQNQRHIAQARRHLSADGSKPSLSDIAGHLNDGNPQAAWNEAKVESVLRKVDQAAVITGLHRDDASDAEPSAAQQSDQTVQLVCALFVRDYRQLSGAVQVVLARIYFLNQTLAEVAAIMELPLAVVRKLHADGVQAAMESAAGALIT